MSSRPFEAAYRGRCVECGDPIEIGDEARYNDDDQVVGEECCGHVYGDWWHEQEFR